MIIVEGRIDSPILREALRAAPGMTVLHEELYDVGGEIRYLFWAEGGDFDAFEAGIARDPTVTRPSVLAEAGDRRLYRVEFTEAGHDVATFPAWGELDMVMLDSRATHEEWQVRVRFPDRDALGGYVDACDERGLSFSIDAIFSGTGRTDEAGAALTAAQREALVTAFEAGYFEVPREASLAEVARRMDRSPQATSERLRRGMGTLVEATVLGA